MINNVMGVVGLVLLGLLIAGFVAGVVINIAQDIHSSYFKEIKVLVRQNKDIKPYLVEYCRTSEKPKVEQLLKEHNYKLVEKEIKEIRTVYGCGKITFADGHCEYQVHFSKNCFSQVEKKAYDALKKELGKEANFVYKEKVYTNKENFE